MPPVSPARIVVVEDNPGDAFLLRRALNAQGEPFILEVITDGERALAFVDELAANWGVDDPCVLILDLHLPKRDGLEILQAIRATPALCKLHLAVYAGTISPLEHAQLLNFDVHLIIQKPNDINGFLDLAKKVFDICHGRTQAAAA